MTPLRNCIYIRESNKHAKTALLKKKLIFEKKKKTKKKQKNIHRVPILVKLAPGVKAYMCEMCCNDEKLYV